MAIVGKEVETYLYLNGIEPNKKAILDNGVEFLKSKCDPLLDDIISKSGSEIDIGVSCIFLRSVKSCFHIKAKSQKELAIQAWNAQWEAILLGALFQCEVGINFQADVMPNDFSKASFFNIPNYALKGLSSGKIKKLTPANHRWLEKYYSNAQILMKDDIYSNAVHSLSSYRWHSMPRAQLALLWSAIEGLFGVDYELSYRLSLYIAKFLIPRSKTNQKKIFDEMKKLYSIRSKAVHGGRLNKINDSVEQSVNILHKLIIKCAEIGKLPKAMELIF